MPLALKHIDAVTIGRTARIEATVYMIGRRERAPPIAIEKAAPARGRSRSVTARIDETVAVWCYLSKKLVMCTVVPPGVPFQMVVSAGEASR